jgi:hypothetical protein
MTPSAASRSAATATIAAIAFAIPATALAASGAQPANTPTPSTLCDPSSCADPRSSPVDGATTDSLQPVPVRENEHQAQFALYALLAVLAVVIPIVAAWQRDAAGKTRTGSMPPETPVAGKSPTSGSDDSRI